MTDQHADWRAIAKIEKSDTYARPNIFVCGASGSGKSTSLRNLDPADTILLNCERKALPFREAKRFKMHAQPANLDRFQHALKRALAAAASIVVVDSFSSLAEMVYAHVIRYELEDTRAAWGRYKDTIHDILLQCKVPDKCVVYTGIESTIQDENMRVIKTVDVQGSLKGKIEKEFEIVLWAQAQGDGAYKFLTNSDGRCSAKSPMGMFDDAFVDNDISVVLSAIRNYYTN